MHRELRVGCALFNDGWFHAAHDAWEEHWLSLPAGTIEEQFLHGLIQYTAAVYHSTRANDKGARGLASSSQGYFEEVPPIYERITLYPVIQYLKAMQCDPTVVTRKTVPQLRIDGHAVTLSDLKGAEIFLAAQILAVEMDLDAEPIEAGIELSKHNATREPFTTLLTAFVQNDESRDLIYTRLAQHVSQEEARQADVRDLFSDDHSS